MTRRPDGALETDVLRVLWAADGPLLPGEINERLDAGYAYTSVATILTRLQAKGLVVRTPAELRDETYAAALIAITADTELARATGLPFDRPGAPVLHGGIRVTLWQTKPLAAKG